MTHPKDDKYSETETRRRYEQALKGAFKTPAQPMKDKPKSDGATRGRPKASARDDE